ncbi:hypothetical protein C8P64_1984 [Christiangramia gaetbulicola]|uniref:Uncharacterized protein n=1 Tax=Christiangramia gaetbulicola TaxID=703340 RepID=A0A2T6AI18_9FLAO|nr:hypothetical protein [Christiangramia gaetbulicola]PTX43456.1 hypothetical protein C8P64_1984 [Christiangramia gaetbulicola]
MLEKTVLRYTGSDLNSFNKGILAEAILFYDKVIVTCGFPDLENFLNEVGYSDLQLLTDNSMIELIIDLDTPICATYKNSYGLPESDFDFYRHFPKSDPKEVLENTFEKCFGKNKKNSTLIDKISTTRFEQIIHEQPVEFVTSLKRKIVENGFGTKICRKVTDYFNPPISTPEVFNYRFQFGEYGIIGTSPIKENISINLPSRIDGKENFHFLPGSFLTLILDTAYTIEISTRYKGSLRGTTLGAICTKEFFLNSLTKIQNDIKEFDLFVNNTITGLANLKGAINSGDKTLKDIVPIFQKKDKFTKWAHEIPADAKLINEYIKSIQKSSWLDKLPYKTGKFIIFSSAGLAMEPITTALGMPGVGTIGGLALSAIDTFILGKIASGWKPDIYIDEVKNKI